MTGIARSGRRLVILLIALTLASPSLAQSKSERWTEVKSEHFLVVTDGSERQGRQLASQFEAVRSLFEETLGLRVESGRPFIVMGFRNEKSMRAAMPEFWEKKGQAHPAGWFLPATDRIYAAIRLDVGDEGPYSIVYHEYTHLVLDLNVRSLPLWIAEGLAQFYGFSRISEKEIDLGRPDRNCINALRVGKLIPLTELFKVDHDSPYYNDADKAQMFYAESWALTHYLMLAEKTEAGRRNRLSQFLSLRGRGVGQDEAARQVFGDLGRLQADLGRYVERSAFPYLIVKPKAGDATNEFGVRVLPPADTAARLGDFQLHDRRPKDAKPLLEEALRLRPDLAAAQESLGFLFMQEGDRSEALRRFERAIAGDSRNFLAHYFYATLIRLEPEIVDRYDRAEASLRTAVQLNPYFAPAFIALADLYRDEEGKLDRALELVRKAVAIEPGNISYQMTLASVLVRAGRYGEALSLAATIERAAGSQGEKEWARSFIEGLGRVQDKTPQGTEPKREAGSAASADGEPPVPLGGRPISYSWSVLSRPIVSGNAVFTAGSGDALFKSVSYDAVWAATLMALKKEYKLLYSDKAAGHIIADPVAASKDTPGSGSLDLFIEKRGPDVGVNIHLPAGAEMPLPVKKALFESLFEDIAINLSSLAIDRDPSPGSAGPCS